MHSLLSLLKPYRKPIIIALMLMITELLVELWQPLLVAKIINEGIKHQDLDVVLLWGGLMVGMALLAFAAGIINSFYAARVSQGYGFDVRKALFEKIQSFSFAGFNQFPTSTLITRVTSDVTQLQNVVFMSLRIMMRAPLLMIGGLTMAFIVNDKLALMLVIVIPLLFVFLVWLMNKGFKLFRSVQERLDRTNAVLRENLLGMRLIRAFVRRREESKRFTEANEALMDRTVAALRLIELTVPLLLLVMNLSLLFILWYGRLEVEGLGANVGEVVAIVNYSARITGALSIISMVLTNLSRARASARRISDVYEAKVDIVDREDVNEQLKVTKGEVKFESVSFQYPGTSTLVLESVSFKAKAAETVAVLGATGSGKSSLFQLIPRLYEASEGRVWIDGIDIAEMKLDVLRKQIGFVAQEAVLFTGTVKENILWGKTDASMEEVIAAAQSAQIHDTIMKLPQQYETVLGQKGVNLSGGQKQRLSIARALIRQPKILLLDDSTSALDLKTEARLLDAISRYACTTMIITQKISTAMRADHILLLDDGKLIAQGHHESLLRESPLYRRMVESQFGEERVSHA